MLKFTLGIEMTNECFTATDPAKADPRGEALAYLLRKVADTVPGNQRPCFKRVVDVNGNAVGHYEIKEE